MKFLISVLAINKIHFWTLTKTLEDLTRRLEVTIHKTLKVLEMIQVQGNILEIFQGVEEE